MIINTIDWGSKILSLKANDEMHIIIATIKAALGFHVTDLIDIFINVSMQYLIATEGVYVWQSLVKIAASYNTKNGKARFQLLLYVNCYLYLSFQVINPLLYDYSIQPLESRLGFGQFILLPRGKTSSQQESRQLRNFN